MLPGGTQQSAARKRAAVTGEPPGKLGRSRQARAGAPVAAAPAPDGYEATEPDAGRFRARQLQAVLRLTPAAKVINIANVMVVCGVSWSAGSPAYLLLWTLAVSGAVCMGLSGWLRDRRHSARDWAPRRTLPRAALWDGLAGPAVGAAAWPETRCACRSMCGPPNGPPVIW